MLKIDPFAKTLSLFNKPDFALKLYCRHSEGTLRHARNLSLVALLEAVRDQKKPSPSTTSTEP